MIIKPDLSHLPIMPEHYSTKLIMDKYTGIAPCVVEGELEAHNAFLVVDNQSFCITPTACDTKEEASWMCWQLAKALEKIKDEEY